MCPDHAASATRGKSRQTDLELPVFIRMARFCHATRLLSVTGKPRFKGSETTTAFRYASGLATQAPQFSVGSIRVLRAVSRVVGGSLIEFAVERRAADLEPARDLRHLAAVMRDREADDLVLHLLERPHLAG